MVKEAEKYKQQDDKSKLEGKIESTLKWLETNRETAEKEVFEEKQKELEQIANPIMTSLYGGAAEGGIS